MLLNASGLHTHRCRPGERRDPYSAAGVVRQGWSDIPPDHISLGLWVPAFAGTTAGGFATADLHGGRSVDEGPVSSS
ncbi:conserved hypothetical protein [Bradyrhizobium sp. ORS 375]|nr:conserved hypothetical protein [Bradyrhizobium sp. ORS 375]